MNKQNKLTVPIKGMHCKSCEMLIEDELKEVKGVERVSLDHKTGEAQIFYHNDKPSGKHIEEAINKAGYSIGTNGPTGFWSTKKSDYQDLGIAFMLLFALYFILKGLGLTSLSVDTGSDALTVPLILTVGLTAGFSTCMALVGGLVLGLSAKHNELHPEATVMQKFRPHLFFNLGRILSYAFFGGLLGLVGSFFKLSAFGLGVLTIAVGLVMLIMGLQLIEIFPWADKLKITLPKSLSRALGLGGHQKEYSAKNSAILGALTFFLPCGFTQAMQVYAIGTGSFFWGAIVMAVFALGTLPGLLSIGGLTSIVKGKFARRFFKLAGLAVLAFAIFNISNGATLAGFDLGFTPRQNVLITANDPNVTLENGVQIVRMKETSNGYEPNNFTIKKGVPVRWIIDAQAPYSCASSIVLGKYNITGNLQAGENIFNFTPNESGIAKFSCSMGMYTGQFNVVSDTDDAAATANVANTIANDQTDLTGGGCGMMRQKTANAAADTGSCGGGNANTAGSCGGSGGGCGCGSGAKQAPANNTPPVAADNATNDAGENIQVIKSTYTANNYLNPNKFTVKANRKVRLEIDVKDNGTGCGNAIQIQGLYENPIPLKAGQPIVMEFTPTVQGDYVITCGMGMIVFGTVTVQ